MATSARYEIFQGPSKFDLMVAFFEKILSPRKTTTLWVVNKANKGMALEVAIYGLKSEGVDDTWLFEGYVREYNKDLPLGRSGKVEGIYSTQTRKGYLRQAEETVSTIAC